MINYDKFKKVSFYGIPKEDGGDSEKNDSKMEDCVTKVMAKGHSKESAIRICKHSLGFTKGSKAEEETPEEPDVPEDATVPCHHCGKPLDRHSVRAGHRIPANIRIPWRDPQERQITITNTWAEPDIVPLGSDCNGLEEFHERNIMGSDENVAPEVRENSIKEMRNWSRNPEAVHPSATSTNWPPATGEEQGDRTQGGTPLTHGEMDNKKVDWMLDKRDKMLAMKSARKSDDEVVEHFSAKQWTQPPEEKELREKVGIMRKLNPSFGSDDAENFVQSRLSEMGVSGRGSIVKGRASASGPHYRRLVKSFFTKHWGGHLGSEETVKTSKDYSESTREEYTEKGGKGEHWALPDGSFPIKDCGDVKDAVHRIGSTNKDKDMVKRHILKRWKALDCGGNPPFSSEREASVRDHISESGPTPVNFITDHEGKLAVGINPATCERCSAPMELHNKWETTKQGSVEEFGPEERYEIIASHLSEEHGVNTFGKYSSSDDDMLIEVAYKNHEQLHKEAAGLNLDLIHLSESSPNGAVDVWNSFQQAPEQDINQFAKDKHDEAHDYYKHVKDPESAEPKPDEMGHKDHVVEEHVGSYREAGWNDHMFNPEDVDARYESEPCPTKDCIAGKGAQLDEYGEAPGFIHGPHSPDCPYHDDNITKLYGATRRSQPFVVHPDDLRTEGNLKGSTTKPDEVVKQHENGNFTVIRTSRNDPHEIRRNILQYSEDKTGGGARPFMAENDMLEDMAGNIDPDDYR